MNVCVCAFLAGARHVWNQTRDTLSNHTHKHTLGLDSATKSGANNTQAVIQLSPFSEPVISANFGSHFCEVLFLDPAEGILK